jgi:hypothetical protein
MCYQEKSDKLFINYLPYLNRGGIKVNTGYNLHHGAIMKKHFHRTLLNNCFHNMRGAVFLICLYEEGLNLKF